eukprot:15034994-Alexandrium_andersonii.AAC.1
MSASLVGSEMCIRDSGVTCQRERVGPLHPQHQDRLDAQAWAGRGPACRACLLYTSDAADDM